MPRNTTYNRKGDINYANIMEINTKLIKLIVNAVPLPTDNP
jgi:hypothetical protein